MVQFSGRILLWSLITIPILTFAITYPVAFTQSNITGPNGGLPICAHKLRYNVNFLSDSIDFSPAANIGTFGIAFTVGLAVWVGLARYEFVKGAIKCLEQQCATSSKFGVSESAPTTVPASTSTSSSPTSITSIHILEHHCQECVIQIQPPTSSPSPGPETDHLISDERGVQALPSSIAPAVLTERELMIKSLTRLNWSSLVTGSLAMTGALVVAAVQYHNGNDVHNLAAAFFFVGCFIYECMCTHLDRRLSVGPKSSWRTCYQILCCSLVGIFFVVSTIFESSVPTEGYRPEAPLFTGSDRVLVETAAGMEISILLLLLSYLMTWHRDFASMTISISIGIKTATTSPSPSHPIHPTAGPLPATSLPIAAPLL